ncbi:MAG: helix-turn-helix domain-containing protein, partial [Candidatus Accumulibacter sp.]|nr:helix-turn-helix domain-containing protein [Accumulibacter sp.]
MAEQERVCFSQLCERFGISRKTGCKWRERARQGGVAALREASCRP